MKSTIFLLLVFFTLSLSMIFVQHDLPTQTSTLFSGSGNCAICHGPAAQSPAVLTDPDGSDISPVTLWRSTMMANAGKDPLWQAKVSAEVLSYPALSVFIEDKCLTCHSPTGRTEALFNGQSAFSMDEMNADPLALDGVTCTVCHQIDPANLGTSESFSGGYVIAHNQTIYGPYENPFLGPMAMVSGYTAAFGAHMSESTLCASCHTLFTPTLDDGGNVIGSIGEQTPYLEWLNSDYPGEELECQGCHMPYIDDPVVIASLPPTLGARTPFAKHYFAGANVFMLRLLKANSESLGVTATTAQMDSTIARTKRLLQEQAAELSASWMWIHSDTLEVTVGIENKTGHKFPTAIPLRRAWVSVRVKSESGTDVFYSGSWDPASGEITGLDAPFEAHHDAITGSDQIQVYEALMQTDGGELTYTLLKGASYIKDNRLPPSGYRSIGPFAADTPISGAATSDPDFNRNEAGEEGSGEDVIHYRIGGISSSAPYSVEVHLLYQSITPRFAEDLFQYDTPEVDAFRTYYEQTDLSPVVIDSVLLAVSPWGTAIQKGTPEIPNDFQLSVDSYPNPFQTEVTVNVTTRKSGTIEVSVFDVSGRLIRRLISRRVPSGTHTFSWNGDTASGESLTSGQYILNVTHQADLSTLRLEKTSMVVLVR